MHSDLTAELTATAAWHELDAEERAAARDAGLAVELADYELAAIAALKQALATHPDRDTAEEAWALSQRIAEMVAHGDAADPARAFGAHHALYVLADLLFDEFDEPTWNALIECLPHEPATCHLCDGAGPDASQA